MMKAVFLFSSTDQLDWAFVVIELLVYRCWPTTQFQLNMLNSRFSTKSLINFFCKWEFLLYHLPLSLLANGQIFTGNVERFHYLWKTLWWVLVVTELLIYIWWLTAQTKLKLEDTLSFFLRNIGFYLVNGDST